MGRATIERGRINEREKAKRRIGWVLPAGVSSEGEAAGRKGRGNGGDEEGRGRARCC